MVSRSCALSVPLHNPADDDLGESVFGINVELFAQKSRGSVTLASPDPLSPPIIDHAYLTDPLDVLVLTEAVRFANKVNKTIPGMLESIH